MKKIVILGALGYLGTELSRIYSGESWKNKIIAIDSRFISERINQLKKWNIEFFQGHILDKDFLNKHLNEADVVHHLAGVTDVAYVKTEANSELDERIRSIAIEGTNNVINSISKKCKLIFPSTHVVFEGLKKAKKNIKEGEKTKPILMYAKSKNQNEVDIKKNHENHVILRLGSVYGYSLDTMRINIMPNLFSKITSQDGVIKLFSGGKQLKSLISIIDVVRCMKFVEDNTEIKNETFHLVNEQTTVKKVAELCKKINPKIKLIITKDATPNLGYTLSNKKLLKTGFKFIYNLENSVKEMVENWKFVKNENNLEHIFKGQNEFIDTRGKISNYELPEPINLIGYIESKKGTVRANHFHPVQEQKCLLVKGQFISLYKDLITKNSEVVTHVVNEGDLIVTKPNVAHTMVFTKDSIFLNLVRGEREHKNYGITHTIPYQLVDDVIKKNLLYSYKFDCRCCGSKNLKRILSLGFQPLANNLIKNKKSKFDTYPLELNFCLDCYNVQLSVSVNPKKMFSNYYYLSSTSKSFRSHFEQASKKYFKEFKLNKQSQIIDIGSNDGVGLLPFKELGIKNLLGIEPAKNLCKISNKKGIKTLNDFLNYKSLKRIKHKADLILASNVFAHSDDLKEMGECILKLLSKNGTAIIEVQYLLKTLKDLTFDNIYHEHYNYWSLTSIKNFFDNLGSKIYKAEEINTHGGSLRIYVCKNLNKKVDKSVSKLLRIEENYGIKKFSTYKIFADKILKIKKNVLNNLKILKKKSNRVIGYGAPAKATTSLNFFGISEEIDFIVEDNKLKHNKYVPGVNIPIYSKNKIKNNKSPILVLAWNFYSEIKKNNKNLTNKFINIKSLEN
ncbi:sugar nucleotide-binding protein [Candidatus Pelagibacter bacterium]|nr:sugar nucleotide-binding protein [Candidatus Pelagibacter bacterium]